APATKMVASGSLMYANFEGGLWQWNGSGWRQLNPAAATDMVASGSTLYVNFAGGLYKWDGTAWDQLNPVPASIIAVRQ
ncbi:MAG: hypothetical protein ACYDHW_14740, partial [Syntrophorhabdaceae bacterium]